MFRSLFRHCLVVWIGAITIAFIMILVPSLRQGVDAPLRTAIQSALSYGFSDGGPTLSGSYLLLLGGVLVLAAIFQLGWMLAALARLFNLIVIGYCRALGKMS